MTTHHSSEVCCAILLSFLLCEVSVCAVYLDHVDVGFSASAIAWVDSEGIFLYSTNQSFALGFSTIGGDADAYYLCVSHWTSKQDVWCANRNSPIGILDMFYFNANGSATLQNSTGADVWSSNSIGASRLQLQETGNLVLLDNVTELLWQSFDHPTDTLLTGQKFTTSMRLVGSRSQSDISEGLYYMSMNDSDLVLYADMSYPQVFWTMASDGKTSKLNPDGVPAYAKIDSASLMLFESDGVTVVYQILLDSYDQTTVRRATLESDGNLHVYFLSGSLWNLAFLAVRDDCSLPLSCGGYGLCSSGGQCSCPRTLVPTNDTDFSQGCSPAFVSSCTDGTNLTRTPVELLPLGNVNYFANQFAQAQGPFSLDVCKRLCLGNCSCNALFFFNDSGSCFFWRELGTMEYDSSANSLGFLKVPSSSGHSGSKNSSLTIILIACGTGLIILGLCFGAWRLHKRSLTQQAPSLAEEDELMDTIPGLPTRFCYKDLEVATKSFSCKLGAGGFGSVYEGLLADNTKVAVKRLENVGQGKKEFWAEVATIGSIHHVHLVQLRGFCAEGSHRLLVYEFMANGSLAKMLFSTQKDGIVLDWNTRCGICLGTARGLAYLHEDCRERIIHCDIKPENILLADNFLAKVSDFGLAKLMKREQSAVFTTLRGTRGYLAPEWLMNYAISDKSDVYSFGMVLLELISGRKNYDPTDLSEKWNFPLYAAHQAEVGKVQLLVDPKLNGLVDEEQVANLTRIALWCIQDEAGVRPSMKKVVEMMEGIIMVPKPPSSPLLAVRLHGRKYNSEYDTGIHEFDNEGITASQLSGPR